MHVIDKNEHSLIIMTCTQRNDWLKFRIKSLHEFHKCKCNLSGIYENFHQNQNIPEAN